MSLTHFWVSKFGALQTQKVRIFLGAGNEIRTMRRSIAYTDILHLPASVNPCGWWIAPIRAFARPTHLDLKFPTWRLF